MTDEKLQRLLGPVHAVEAAAIRQHIAEHYIPKERVRCDCGSTEWECYHCANPVSFLSEQAGSDE